MSSTKVDQFAGVLCDALVGTNCRAKVFFIFLALAATAIADDSAPAKLTINVNVVAVVLATRADCTSQVQSAHKGTLAAFTLPIEQGYECTEDILADLDLKAIRSAKVASPTRPQAVVVRHTFVPR